MNSQGSRRKYKGKSQVTSRIRLIALLGVGCLSTLTSSIAQAADSRDKDDEYNFSWLDPDKKIYVLQNRKYLKSNRVLLSLMGGFGLSNPYRSTYNVDPRLAYYINETWGIETFYMASFNKQNDTFKTLQYFNPSALPVIRAVKGQFGALLHWSPWYAKINVFNSILYFDWFFYAGAGSIQIDLDTNRRLNQPENIVKQNFFALYVGTGHQYHISKDFIARIDLMGAYYQAPLHGTVGESTWFPNYSFNLGVGFRL